MPRKLKGGSANPVWLVGSDNEEIDTAHPLPVDAVINGAAINNGNPLPVDIITDPVPVEEIVRAASAWTTLLNDQVFNNVTTTINSSEHDVSEESALWVHIYINSTLAPTNIRILPQFEDDAQWCDFEEGYWASLYWEDTVTTGAGVHKSFLLPCGGQDNVRFNVTATGTDANNRFNCTIKVREFHGNFGVAHA